MRNRRRGRTTTRIRKAFYGTRGGNKARFLRALFWHSFSWHGISVFNKECVGITRIMIIHIAAVSIIVVDCVFFSVSGQSSHKQPVPATEWISSKHVVISCLSLIGYRSCPHSQHSARSHAASSTQSPPYSVSWDPPMSGPIFSLSSTALLCDASKLFLSGSGGGDASRRR